MCHKSKTRIEKAESLQPKISNEFGSSGSRQETEEGITVFVDGVSECSDMFPFWFQISFFVEVGETKLVG